MRSIRSRLELGVELRSEIERVVRDLDDLDEATVWGQPGELHPVRGKQFAVRVIELVAMPVTLEHDGLPVGARRQRARIEYAGVAAEAHRAALVRDVAL